MLAERERILESYATALAADPDSVWTRSQLRDRVMAAASEVLREAAARVRGGASPADDDSVAESWMAEAARTQSQVSPVDLLGAAAALFDVTVSSLARHVAGDPGLLPGFVTAILSLNQSIGRRIGEAVLDYAGYLLERVDQAHIDERRRIARDLHDRLGESMSAALRQLELYEIATANDPLTPSPWGAMAKNALTEAMHGLRVVTSGLRQDPIRSLETALVQYLDTVGADADLRLRVSGDETWAPSIVIEEAFLIVREAIRNALRHGSPRLVLIGVALAPHELHARVEDDGRGFAVAGVSSGSGLASMRERTDVVGGRLTVCSVPGQGTQVELLVPLPGRHDE